MASDSPAKRVVIGADPASLARLVADRFLVRVQARIRDGRVAHIALTGGSMGSAVLQAVAEDPRTAELDWSLVHFWWGDERFVPRDHPDRNAGQARAALLDRIPVPAENVHEMAASDEGLTLDEGADAYAAELARFGDAERPWPSFAVCFLGVGPDGHVASLFPDRPEITVSDAAVLPVRDSPKPPPERITLTRPVINASKRVWLVLTGAEKASALGLALAGANYENVPAAGAKGRKRTVFFVDEAAAAEVAPDLIDVDY
ncbi:MULTISPECIES: 6-phosphogluconolactonase [unclassified Microbacterium]|uniref:6-phosphogluconolactonase n=1 Tax=unclassified Microbacterium TaxID=2609290 RepID=UPI001AC02EE8|nr:MULTISPECIES: 6-phosphogluconolactonase [unclassified Microbacterium]MBN9158573.1 6-phosphogluconolactonase [Microbacterium sp.]MBS1898745.1 6-phosphogluconolactonase [Actinomycetota bacterium]